MNIEFADNGNFAAPMQIKGAIFNAKDFDLRYRPHSLDNLLGVFGAASVDVNFPL